MVSAQPLSDADLARIREISATGGPWLEFTSDEVARLLPALLARLDRAESAIVTKHGNVCVFHDKRIALIDATEQDRADFAAWFDEQVGWMFAVPRAPPASPEGPRA